MGKGQSYEQEQEQKAKQDLERAGHNATTYRRAAIRWRIDADVSGV